MKLDQSLLNTIEKSSNNFLFSNFKTIIDELNFKDEMLGDFTQGEYNDGLIWIQLEFNNSWTLIADDNGMFTIIESMGFNKKSFFMGNTKQILQYMEKKKIRKTKKCEYKDAELYILNFKDN